MLTSGALQPLLANLAQPATLTLLRNCTWSLSNFCRGKPQPSLRVIGSAIPVLANLLRSNIDDETMVDVAWALSYISDGDNDRIQAVVNEGVIPMLVAMLGSPKPQCIVPALRTLGNIVSGDDTQTQAVVNADVLSQVVKIISNPKKNIRKETCWMLSNIAAGNIDQVHVLVNTPDLISKIMVQLSSGAEWDVRKEAAWVVSNIATGGNRNHVQKIVEHGVMRHLCDLLVVGESRILLVAMDAIESILKHAGDMDTASSYIRLIEEAEGVDRLEGLQEHENEEVYQKAVKLIEEYFNGEEDNDDEQTENITPAPSSSNNHTYSFGMSTLDNTSKMNSSKAFNFGSNAANASFTFGSF